MTWAERVVEDLTVPPGERACIRFGHRAGYVLEINEHVWANGRAVTRFVVHSPHGPVRLQAEVAHSYPTHPSKQIRDAPRTKAET